LGETLPAGFAPAASLWGISQLFVRNQRAAAAGAGFGGSVLAAGNKLFDAIITKPSGVIYRSASTPTAGALCACLTTRSTCASTRC
jgi:hypothetical protein